MSTYRNQPGDRGRIMETLVDLAEKCPADRVVKCVGTLSGNISTGEGDIYSGGITAVYVAVSNMSESQPVASFSIDENDVSRFEEESAKIFALPESKIHMQLTPRAIFIHEASYTLPYRFEISSPNVTANDMLQLLTGDLELKTIVDKDVTFGIRFEIYISKVTNAIGAANIPPISPMSPVTSAQPQSAMGLEPGMPTPTPESPRRKHLHPVKLSRDGVMPSETGLYEAVTDESKDLNSVYKAINDYHQDMFAHLGEKSPVEEVMQPKTPPVKPDMASIVQRLFSTEAQTEETENTEFKTAKTEQPQAETAPLDTTENVEWDTPPDEPKTEEVATSKEDVIEKE